MNILKYSFMLLSAVTLTVSACSNDEPLVRYEPAEPGPGPEPGGEYVVVCDFETTDLGFKTNDALEYSVVENPDKQGGNTSDHYGQVISGGGQWELIYSEELAEPFDFTKDGAKFTMKVNSPKINGKIYFKLEGSGVNAQEITDVVSAASNRWETLTYDFTDRNLPDGKYNKIVLLFDAGETGSGEKWLFDDIFQMQGESVDPGPGPTPGEGQENYSDFETSDLEFQIAGSDDMQYEVIANPVTDGNDSEHVARVVTGSGQWELLYSRNLEKPFAFSKYGAEFSVSVYAPKAGASIYMKLESSAGAEPKEITSVTSSEAGKWITYTYDFSSFGLPDYTYDRILLLFDAGVAAPGETWYFDDVIGPKGEKKSEPQPAELVDFCNFEDVTMQFNINDSDLPMSYEVIENPYRTGINTSAHVGHVTSGGHQWELLWSDPVSDPMVFSSSAVFTMKVYSPKANGKVYFKLEGTGVAPQEITNVVVPNANEWTELTFDFSSRNLPDGKYTQIILLFDAGETGSGENWYFDDIKGPDNKAGTLMKRVGDGPVLTYGMDQPDWRREHIANAAILTPAESPDGKWRMYVRGSGYNPYGSYHDQIGLFTQEAADFKPAGPWTEYPSNPIIAHGDPGTCDELHLLDCAPCVGADGEVWFFYQAVRGTLDNKQGSLACRRSADGGISFTAGKMLRDGVGCSDVVYHGGKYYIYYGYGYNNGLMKVDCAVTSNPETLAGADVHTVLLPGGGPADFDLKSVNGSRIFRLDGVDKWFMVYQGSDRHFDFPDRFHVAYSDDLLNWTKVQNTRPFFERGNAGRWDQGGIWFGEVFEHEGTLYMYYEGWGCEGDVPDRDEPYFAGGHSSTGCASVGKDAFLRWCGLQ